MFTNEMERMRKMQKMPLLDEKRYLSPEPAKELTEDDVDGWKIRINNLSTRLEEMRRWSMDLKLLRAHGPNSWKLYAEQMESLLQSKNNILADVERKIFTTNRKRKIEQESARLVINNLTEKWQKLVKTNNEIETACKVLELRIKNL